MFKKISLAAALATMTMSAYSFAGNFYMGPSLVLQMNRSHNNNHDYVGIGPKFTLGYGTRLSEKYFLAGELFGQFGSLNLSHGDDDVMKSSRTVGVSLLPAYALTEDTKIFGRVGAVESKFSDLSSYTPGAQIGLGLQTHLSEKWDVRGEYNYTRYRSVDDIGVPQSNAVSIGVIRTFK